MHTTQGWLTAGRGWRRGSVAKGCLIAAGIALVLVIAAAVTLALTWRKIAGAGLSAVATTVIDQSAIPTDQKAVIKTRIDGVVADWKDNKITGEQLGKVMEEISNSPAIPAAMAGMADKQYVEGSALTEEEKTAGRRALQRFARGVYEKKLTDDDSNEVMQLIQTTEPAGNKQLKKTLTIEELKAFLAKAKAKADKAEVPDEAFEINYASEIDRAINRALAPTK